MIAILINILFYYLVVGLAITTMFIFGVIREDGEYFERKSLLDTFAELLFLSVIWPLIFIPYNSPEPEPELEDVGGE